MGRFGDIDGPKPCEFIGSRATTMSHTPVSNPPEATGRRNLTLAPNIGISGATLGVRKDPKLRHLNSAELPRPRTFLKIRPDIFDVEPELGLKLGPNSACFDDDPKH